VLRLCCHVLTAISKNHCFNLRGRQFYCYTTDKFAAERGTNGENRPGYSGMPISLIKVHDLLSRGHGKTLTCAALLPWIGNRAVMGTRPKD
jgi:hypothetical protein